MFLRSRLSNHKRMIGVGILIYITFFSIVCNSSTLIHIMESNSTDSYLDSVSMDMVLGFQEEFIFQTIITEESLEQSIINHQLVDSVEIISRIFLSSSTDDWSPLTTLGVRNDFFETFSHWFSLSYQQPLSLNVCYVRNSILSQLGLQVGSTLNLSMIDTETGEYNRTESYIIGGTYDTTYGEIESKLNPYQDLNLPEVITTMEGLRNRYNDLFFGNSNGVNLFAIIRLERSFMQSLNNAEILTEVQSLRVNFDQQFLPYLYITSHGLEDALNSQDGWQLAIEGLLQIYILPSIIASAMLIPAFVILSNQSISDSEQLLGRGGSRKQQIIWQLSLFTICELIAIAFEVVIDFLLTLQYLEQQSPLRIFHIAVRMAFPVQLGGFIIGFILTLPCIYWSTTNFKTALDDEIKQFGRRRLVVLSLILFLFSYFEFNTISNQFWFLGGFQISTLLPILFDISCFIFLILCALYFGFIAFRCEQKTLKLLDRKDSKHSHKVGSANLSKRSHTSIITMSFLLLLLSSMIYTQVSIASAENHIRDVIWYTNGSDIKIETTSDVSNISSISNRIADVTGVASVAIVVRTNAFYISEELAKPLLVYGVTDSWWNTVFLRNSFFLSRDKTKASIDFIADNSSALTNFGDFRGYNNGTPIFNNTISIGFLSNTTEMKVLSVVDRLTNGINPSSDDDRSYLPGYSSTEYDYAVVHLDWLLQNVDDTVHYDIFIKLDSTQIVQPNSFSDIVPNDSSYSFANQIYENDIIGIELESVILLTSYSQLISIVILSIGMTLLVYLRLQELRRQNAILVSLGGKKMELLNWMARVIVFEMILILPFSFLISYLLITQIGTWPIYVITIVSAQNWDQIPELLIFSPLSLSIIIVSIFCFTIIMTHTIAWWISKSSLLVDLSADVD